MCGRWSSVKHVPLEQFRFSDATSKTNPKLGPLQQSEHQSSSILLPAMHAIEDEISHFRKIHVLERAKVIESKNEAESILKENLKSARALQYLGWSLLTSGGTLSTHRNEGDLEAAKEFLQESTKSGMYR